jgi:hypothetical protein
VAWVQDVVYFYYAIINIHTKNRNSKSAKYLWKFNSLDAGKQKAERGLVLSLQAFWLPSFPADDHFVQGKVAQI